MWPRPGGDRLTFAPSGLWIAAIGFFVTRATVTLAAYESRTQFLISGVVPLVLGLVLSAFGVALLVGSADRSFVRSVAVWTTAGTVAMSVLVALTLVGAGTDPSAQVGRNAILSNFLVGGAILGALTGIYAGENRRNRAELHRQANRLVTINRILRHEVLNAVAVVRGRAETLQDPDLDPIDGGSMGPIIRESDRIVDTIEDVKHLARSSSDGLTPVDLGSAVEACVEDVRSEHPEVEFDLQWDGDESVEVWADGQLSHALHPLIENAAAYDDSPEPRVTVDLAVGRHLACVRITDTGPGMPDEHRETLERGTIADFDDPGAGFGTNVARLFVEGYGGAIHTDVTETGTSVEVELRRTAGDRPTPSTSRTVGTVAADRLDLLLAVGASLVAGGAMGLFVLADAGVIPVIGALYGVSDPLVGWITHEFHSVVFGLIYLGFLSLLPEARRHRPLPRLGVAVAWSLALWIGAAGLIMPVWLTLVGIPASLPSVSLTGLASHLVWGLALAAVFHAGGRLRDRHEGA